MGGYQSVSSATNDEGGSLSASSSSCSAQPTVSLPIEFHSSRIKNIPFGAHSNKRSAHSKLLESDYKRRRRIVQDIAKMRDNLAQDDIQRYQDLKTMRKPQHDILIGLIGESNNKLSSTLQDSNNRMIQILEKNATFQQQVFAALTTLIQKLEEK
ncbi:hypothetical protein BG015_007924 [Linnemannia schmuckeri]|uniref:Uncharacterized protein n=1 Tax=Linnemannia schmuckeri TaxID=64567 RepID=A0A9P5VAX4_9FUNG|nr:hypothetical protein BG015_007924 [Linnemannia schmuckeri]